MVRPLAYPAYLVRARSSSCIANLGMRVQDWLSRLSCSALCGASRRQPRQWIHGSVDPATQFLTMPLVGMVLFAVFDAGGHQPPQVRQPKRLMLLASISLVEAPIAQMTAMLRQLPIWLDAAVFTAFTIVMSYRDVQTRCKVRPGTLYGGPANVLVTSRSRADRVDRAWQSVAFWMMSFAGPP